MTLEQVKELETARKKHEQFEGKHIPIGAVVVTEEGDNKATIIGVSDNKVVLSCGVYGEADTRKLTFKELLTDWLFETPNGLVICGLPPKKEEEIITNPNEIKKEFEIIMPDKK
jgi:hypothetical protein